MIRLGSFLSAIWELLGLFSVVLSVFAAFKGEWAFATYVLVLALHFDRQSDRMERG